MARDRCLTCGFSSFTPRLIVDTNAMNDRLRSDWGAAASVGVKETLLLLRKDYQDYSSEIARLQLQIRHLSFQQRQLNEYESQLQSLVSPIRTLPSEVLLIIFDLVSQDNRMREDADFEYSHFWSGNEDRLAAMPALVLSSVCSRWRQLSLSCSTLWSRISLIMGVSAKPTSASRGFTATVALYLKRSGTSSLRLRFDTRGPVSDAYHPVFALIGQFTHRWQYLEFIGDGDYLSRNMFSIPDDVVDFPVLEKIVFDDTSRQSLDLFAQAPQLHHFKYGGVTNPLHGSIFPWHQLTSLDVCTVDTVDWVVALCPNLISLRLRPLYLKTQVAPTMFHSLKSLTVVLGILSITLSSLLCPALTSLTLTPNTANMILREDLSLRGLESFLSQSRCTLTTFSIQGIYASDIALVGVLQRLPFLTSLTVEDHHDGNLDSSLMITPALIRSLHSLTPSTLRPSSTPLLPKLRRLFLTYTGKTFDDAGFVDMIESRCLSSGDATGVEPLRSLVLTSLDRTPDLLEAAAEIYKPLKLLDNAGFMLIIK